MKTRNATRRRAPLSDEREFQFDVRGLDSGHAVEVFLEDERRWVQGEFHISTAGDALVAIPRREALSFEQALLMGLKRVLH
jgi:hypothetical protein